MNSQPEAKKYVCIDLTMSIEQGKALFWDKNGELGPLENAQVLFYDEVEDLLPQECLLEVGIAPVIAGLFAGCTFVREYIEYPVGMGVLEKARFRMGEEARRGVR